MPEQRPDPGDNLRYVCDMLEQLKLLAAGAGHPVLAYLIDVARLDASKRLEELAKRPGSG